MKKALVILTLLFTVGISHAAIVIDDYSTAFGGQIKSNFVAGTYTYTDSPAPAGAVGVRKGTITATGSLPNVELVIYPTNKIIALNTSGTLTGATAKLEYDSSLNLTGLTAIEFEAYASGIGTTLPTYTVTLSDGLNSASGAVQLASSGGAFLPYSISHANYTGINLSNIVKITIDISASGDPTHIPDLAFKPMTVIPEPATMVLLGLGGLLLRKRK